MSRLLVRTVLAAAFSAILYGVMYFGSFRVAVITGIALVMAEQIMPEDDR